MELEPMTALEELLWRIGPTIIASYYWALFTLGVGICVWAFVRTRRKAYLLISCFFLSPYLLRAVDAVGRVANKEEALRIEAYFNRTHQDAELHDEYIVIDEDYRLPIFETLLLLGIFSIAKRDRSRDSGNAPQSSIATRPSDPTA